MDEVYCLVNECFINKKDEPEYPESIMVYMGEDAPLLPVFGRNASIAFQYLQQQIATAKRQVSSLTKNIDEVKAVNLYLQDKLHEKK